MKPLLLTHFTATSCLGRGVDATLDALRGQRGGLAPCSFERADLDTWTGAVDGVDAQPVRADLRDFECRNNRLAQIGLTQDGFAERVEAARARHGAGRIGVFVGTSTAGILETELAYRHRDPQTGALPADFRYAHTHSPYSSAAFVRAYFGLHGPAMSISSACSSGAKVFGSARRMLEAGLIDAAIVGGVDSLCLTTLYGFNSLELLSRQPCKPFDIARDGISIGEAAAFALLERADGLPGQTPGLDDDAILLLGVGESSDAHHMSTPHPEGLGARLAMEQALASAGIAAGEIDYINLHGTATASNDAAESCAVNALFSGTPCSSTKGATGHTLGAAGALEAVIAALALRHQLLPAGINTIRPDPALALDYLLTSRPARLRTVLSNAFGFGGTNCSLVLGRADSLATSLAP
ncbi:beta-ketoacyl-[acyl-carrier-protein] synthase family protein [Ralstonia solanacearum]|uniref:beta-ketoacyl-[acyl-carrier-protein] synthase family protein n=1 Tax=Ralstonia solanacearum TaxID=305 RepID=UPI00078D3703|nr:beta-ketoacyl-[acyl-carrier-protein] synthase family protein [Ralstonia solanacearum]AMP38628.1 beta-ketoacyl-[acyl-carrier-protein] synthase II [Ralstonia solanacearum]AXV87454.1 beta-ketoacyl-[acyl-carrier-protein] synthase II [Ralstonia solanacearum]AXW06939.1 beta-ketoacyl-[acyl-carrier-protein] synthase II [Ralstonia solanacearum]AXW24701.1 beta-ketoacyl-[acyl-carrier-protein] synthase II [Ralstonia solanacearum]AXW81617.1 beta-ketoacyl-[acyl-carrier-protein] synthase II [Ralstonia sol